MRMPDGNDLAEAMGVADARGASVATGTTTNFDPSLPWGCWLRFVPAENGDAYVDDVSGRTFPSLRSAFWNGRLGMPRLDPEPPVDLLDVVRVLLAAAASGLRDERPEITELFHGSAAAERLSILWLASAGLVEPDGSIPDGWKPTGEGWSALEMLSTPGTNAVGIEKPETEVNPG